MFLNDIDFWINISISGSLCQGELSVVKDEVLQVIEVIDRHWVKCQGMVFLESGPDTSVQHA